MKNTMDNTNKYLGTGRRKSAIARVTISKGKGKIEFINWKPFSETDNKEILSPLDLFEGKNNYDITIKTIGGGVSSRIDAIKLAIARALIGIDPELKTTLRKNGYLTRDPREKERKKPGLRGARRAPQWAKR